VTRLDGVGLAGALRDVNPLTRKGAALFSAQGWSRIGKWAV